jgi:hypothetical protein
MAFPIGSVLNQVPGPPYDSQRDALLYEILQALGGNPEAIMSKPWTSGNEGNQRPPYTSLTDALLYEIWMVVQQGGVGGGTGGTGTIYYGIIKNNSAIVPDSGITCKIIGSGGNYYIVPPVIANLAGNDATLVRLWVSEPEDEPIKSATLWLRNFQSAFTNQPILPNGLMSVQNINGFRVYVSEEIPARLFDGGHFGPVFFAKSRQVNVNWGAQEVGMFAITGQVTNIGFQNFSLLIENNGGTLLQRNGPGILSGNGYYNKNFPVAITVSANFMPGANMEIEISDDGANVIFSDSISNFPYALNNQFDLSSIGSFNLFIRII